MDTAISHDPTVPTRTYCRWSLQCDFLFVLTVLLAAANMFLISTFLLVIKFQDRLKKHTPNQVELQPVIQADAEAQVEEGQGEEDEANPVEAPIE